MKQLALCLLGVGAALHVRVALADPVDMVRMERAIDLRVASGDFMGTILVARDGQVLLNNAYGLSNVALKIASYPEVRFPLGSVTKQFTAAAILLLEERGKLSINDPIKKYLPDAPAAWDEITLFHLLTQASGIPNSMGLPRQDPKNERHFTPEQLVERLRDLPLEFRPGTSCNYSNSGYVLLGYLIEKISGKSYERFLREQLFAPLNMWNTKYEPSLAKISHRARGYTRTPEGPVAARDSDLSVAFSAAGLYSTSGDLLKWVQGLYGGKVLKPASLQKMTTPHINHCAFGIDVESAPNGGQIYSQSGAIEGFETRVVYVPAEKLVVIVLANLSGGAADDLVLDLRRVAEGDVDRLVSDRVPVSLSPQALERLTGHYWSEDGSLITVLRKDDHLQAEGTGQTLDLYPQSVRQFFAKTQNVEVTFTDDDEGRIESLLFRLGDHPLHAARITEAMARELAAERDRKLREQTPTPGSETALRQLLDEIIAGTVDYSRLGAGFAEVARRRLPRMHELLDHLGAIRHTDFMGVAPVTGADIYRVTFERGTVEVRISLGPDGKIWSQAMRSGQS